MRTKTRTETVAGEGAIQTIRFQRALVVGRCDLRELKTMMGGESRAEGQALHCVCTRTASGRFTGERLVYTSRQAICVYFRLLSPAARLTTYGLVAGAKVLIVL